MAVKCKGCGAAIEYVLLENGKRHPVNARPITVLLRVGAAHGQSEIYRYVSAYQSHFATCPQADRFRKPGARQRGGRGRGEG